MSNGKIYYCSFVDLTFHPYFPAVNPDDALHDGQSDSGPLEVFLRMEAMEGQEHLFLMVCIKTGSVVSDVKHRTSVLLNRPEFYPGLLSLGGELPQPFDYLSMPP